MVHRDGSLATIAAASSASSHDEGVTSGIETGARCELFLRSIFGASARVHILLLVAYAGVVGAKGGRGEVRV